MTPSILYYVPRFVELSGLTTPRFWPQTRHLQFSNQIDAAATRD